MCDCEVRNHPGSRCGSVNCLCHLEANAIVNNHLDSKKYYLSFSIDNITETQGAAMIDAVCNINGTLVGISVSWHAPLGETE